MIAGVTEGARGRFWAGLSGARRSDMAKLPGWDGRLNTALDEAALAGAAAWLAARRLSPRAAAARLNGRRRGRSRRWWDHLRAWRSRASRAACVRGVDGALERFEAPHGAEIARIAQALRAARACRPDDLISSAREAVHTRRRGGGPPAIAPRIELYRQGLPAELGLASPTTRTFIDCCRVPRRAARGARSAIELVAVLPEPKGDPELALLKREHVTHFKASFAEAVGVLDSADRLLLKQHLVERLTIDQLGALYHLHRASAARRIAKARDALLVATRIALARRLGLPPERLASVLELVASRLEASIERLLA
jgi:RNA polymerase sigma-70 factor (ECF subfamily)